MDGMKVSKSVDVLEPHPLLAGFEFSDGDLDAEAEDLQRRGAPVTFYKLGDTLVDNYNRYEACLRAAVEVNFIEWDRSASLADHLLNAVLPRVHLTEGQSAANAVRFADQYAEEAQQSSLRNLVPNARGLAANAMLGAAKSVTKPSQTALLEKSLDAAHVQHPVISQSCLSNVRCADAVRDGPFERAARRFGVSVRYVFEAKKLREHWPHFFKAVAHGLMTIADAQREVREESRREKARKLAADAARNGDADRSNSAETADELIVGDCVKGMASMVREERLFDLIFADPPYNIGIHYDSDPSGKFGDRLPDAAYQDWSLKWIKQCAWLLRPNGSIYVMINSRWQAPLWTALSAAGLHFRSTVIWHDNFPNHTDANFQPAARFIHYFTRSAKNFTWNADAIRVESERDRLGDKRRVHGHGIVPHDVWDDIFRLPGNAADRVPWPDSPPQVPAAILDRIIKASSNEGDRVLDPFTGNGTTWKQCRRLKRKFTGIERSAKYAAQARQWAMEIN
jgi:DNA modification methylase